MAKDICPWTGKPWTDAEQRTIDMRKAGYNGWVSNDGEAIASRTDPKTGQALGFESRGWSGNGTPDEDRAGRARRRGRR